MAGYLVYVKWQVLRSWTRKSRGGGWRYPYRYATDQRHFRPKRGDTVWVVACPRWHRDRLPPTLVARLQLSKDYVDLDTATDLTPLDRRFRRFGRYLAVADPDHSRYYPINNCYRTLLSLDFQTHRPISRCARCTQVEVSPEGSLYAHIPTHLQTVRRLTDEDVRRLNEYAEATERGQVVFISYRHGESDDLVRAFADEVGRQGAAYWLDEEMILYQAKAEQDWLPRERLEQMLSDAIQQAYIFVAFASPTYLESDWVRYEIERARFFADQGHVRRLVAVNTVEPAAPLDFTAELRDVSQEVEKDRAVRQIARELMQAGRA